MRTTGGGGGGGPASSGRPAPALSAEGHGDGRDAGSLHGVGGTRGPR